MIWIRSITIVILIKANLSSIWLVPFIYADFEVREAYIVNELCMQRNKPITVCGGKCYLSKQLKKAAEQQQKEQKCKQGEMITLFQQSIPVLLRPANYYLLVEINHSASSPNLIDPHLAGIFHPPQS